MAHSIALVTRATSGLGYAARPRDHCGGLSMPLSRQRSAGHANN